MKTFVAALVVLVAISSAQAGLDREKSIDILKKCKAETNAKEDPVEVYEKEKLPVSKEGKCMMACAMKKEGLMSKDGKVSAAKMSEFMTERFNEDPDKLEKAAEAIGKCSVSVDPKGKESCQLAYEYLACGQEHGVKLN